MGDKKDNVTTGAAEAAGADAAKERAADAGEPQITTSGWSEDKSRPKRKDFPGPRHSADEPLRVAMSREAYADLTAHAKESLSAEICGVLVGDLCEDDAGPWVSVVGTIAGTAARKGSTHVTFTQETWNQIHKDKDERFRKKQIVGWYHTHPGFGVEFSEMDVFIQKNFFSAPAQIAFVTDPLGGEEAILVNTPGGIAPVSRFWVDGRERRCTAASGDGAAALVPGGATSSAGGGGASAASDKSIRAMEERLTQVIAAVEAQHAALNRFLTGIFMFVGFCVCLGILWYVWTAMTSPIVKPPELVQYIPVPIQLGDKAVMLGVGIAKFDVPKEAMATYVEIERQKQKAEEEERKRQEKAAAAETQKSGGGAGDKSAAAPATVPTSAGPAPTTQQGTK